MPPQVIDLLSSPENNSPQLPAHKHPAPRLRRPAPQRDMTATALWDDIDTSLLEYVDYDTPATKRRRLSPAVRKNAVGDNGQVQVQEPPQRVVSAHRQESAAIVLSEDDGIQPDSHSISQLDRGNALWNAQLSDPILCSSSAPELRAGNGGNNDPLKENGNGAQNRGVISLDDSIFDLGEDPLPSLSQQSVSSQPQLSSRTAALLASIETKPGSNTAAAGGAARPASSSKSGTGGRHKVKARASHLPSDEEDAPSEGRVARGRPKRADKATSADKSAKAAERERAKLRKEQQKAEEKERKQKLKEEKEKQKRFAADMAEVNKSKMDKKVSTPEMIIDVSESLKDTSVGNQVGEFMKHLGVETNFVPTQTLNVIYWRRKVAARYNEEAGHWEPCPLTIERDEHVLCFLSAQHFVDLAVSNSGEDDLENHVLKILRRFPNCKPIYLIESLTSWMKKNQNSRNRAYQAAVRRQFNDNDQNGDTSAPNAGRRTKNRDAPPPPVDDDTIEDALLQLQVNYNCLIHHTSAPAESAEWIKNFTEHISTIPYRQERMNLHNAGFCMDVGQVKSGDDAEDTYVKMLQEVQRVTAPMAYGIATQFPDARALVRATKQEGPLMLQDVKVFSLSFLIPACENMC